MVKGEPWGTNFGHVSFRHYVVAKEISSAHLPRDVVLCIYTLNIAIDSYLTTEQRRELAEWCQSTTPKWTYM